MNYIKYLKEKLLTYLFLFLALLFFLIVYRLDQHFHISKSNAVYIFIGWFILFLLFVFIDYLIFNSRIKDFKAYCRLHTAQHDPEDFSYPVDREYATIVHHLMMEFEEYKADVRTKSAEELEFITRWVHDIKIPIAALRLIMDNYDVSMPKNFYQAMDLELVSIEESIQRVFYEIKSNTLRDDYKLARVSTKKLIGQALKGYSSFFSYKSINITIEGEDYKVLTDEKWSGYVLAQIISNAVKHTPIRGKITITTSKKDNNFIITVKNEGKGILPQDLGQIFKKGYTSTEDRLGTNASGYGLYLSKKLMDQLGHQLTVESVHGAYASFQLTFIERETLHHMTKM
ncbi:sensor histidine kinase [Alkaliphilus transvaalensis]|uniref:sensor histidine kinase n=1 Tax=Alkaliphilus transvaalensis TaxID=114628 RepID=UPI00047DEF5D|nr:sensor histidine kinase [Alkaliphilus transvaalensis]